MKVARHTPPGLTRRLLAASVFAAAAALVAGCHAVHGLGTDLQYLSDSARGIVYVDDPARD